MKGANFAVQMDTKEHERYINTVLPQNTREPKFYDITHDFSSFY